jgi:hypothetical protein
MTRIPPNSPAYESARRPAIARFHDEMMRISIAPEWAKLSGFEARIPSTVELLTRRRDES